MTKGASTGGSVATAGARAGGKVSFGGGTERGSSSVASSFSSRGLSRFSSGRSEIGLSKSSGPKTNRYGSAFSQFRTESQGPRISLDKSRISGNKNAELFRSSNKPDIGMTKRTEMGFGKQAVDRATKPNVISQRMFRTVRQPDATVGQLREPRVVMKGLPKAEMPARQVEPSVTRNPRAPIAVDRLQRVMTRPNATVSELQKIPTVPVRNTDKIVIPAPRKTETVRKEWIKQPRVEPIRQPERAPIRPVEVKPTTSPAIAENKPAIHTTQLERVKHALILEIARTASKPTELAQSGIRAENKPNNKPALQPHEGSSYLTLMKKRLAEKNGTVLSAKTKTSAVAHPDMTGSVVVHPEEEKKKKKKKWTFGESWRIIKTKVVERTKSKTTVRQMVALRQVQKQEVSQVVPQAQMKTEVQMQTKQKASVAAAVQAQPEASVTMPTQTQTLSGLDVRSEKTQKLKLTQQLLAINIDEEKGEEKYAIAQETQKNREEVARKAISQRFADANVDKLAGAEIAEAFADPSIPTTSPLLLEEGYGPRVEVKQDVDPTDEGWRKEFAVNGLMTKAEAQQIVVFSIDRNRAVRKGEGKKASKDEVEKVRGIKKSDYELVG